MSADFSLPDARSTEALGAALAQTLPDRAVIFLHGQLGAGKSTLARAMLRALGVRGAIKSPTYGLVERYPLDSGEAVHLDLYRIADSAELEFLGLDDLAASTRLWLVEWPEKGGSALPDPDLRIELAVTGEGRHAQLLANSQMARDWLNDLSKIAGSSGSS
jgi:tRNA threonylcarbamoyladenosine biosynthesis protein TsaE